MSTLRINGHVETFETSPPVTVGPSDPFPWLAPPSQDQIPPALWEEAFAAPLRAFLHRPGKSFRARLVECTWQLSSGASECPPDLPRIVEWIHAGSLIVDDIQDGSTHRRGRATLHEEYGVPLALNTGNSLYFLPLTLLGRMGVAGEIELELYRRIGHAMLECHRGQALDLKAKLFSLEQRQVPEVVAAISNLKTASLMELAATLGPIAACAPCETVDAFAVFGNRVGIALQMLNDLSDLTGTGDPHKRYEDLCHGKVTWPWAWAAISLAESDFQTLVERLRNTANCPARFESLAQQLVDITAHTGRDAIRRLLDESVGALQHRLGDDVDLSRIQEELNRLERSYA